MTTDDSEKNNTVPLGGPVTINKAKRSFKKQPAVNSNMVFMDKIM